MKFKLPATMGSQYLVLIATIVLGAILLGVSSGGNFFGPVSMQTFFQFLAVPILIGLAQMITLAVGQLNLAIGAIGGVAACLAAVMVADWGFNPWLGGLVALVVGAVAGIANGILVVVTKINGFIVTLATMTVLLGVQYALVNTRTISADNWKSVAALGKASWFGLPAIFVIAIIVAVMVGLAFKFTTTGRHLLASGDNEHAATLAGISNDRSLTIAHGASGLIAGFAGFISFTSLPGVNQSVGGDWLLSSFAAPIIGGVSLTGGTVAVFGTVLAAFVVRLVDSARAEFQLAPAWVNLVIGAVILGTVALGRLRETRETAKAGMLRARVANHRINAAAVENTAAEEVKL
ncbi:ABC transporter permease [Arthrobacter sp. HY1533]|uniref:ABC transporter permease n=1 Tax=Arthrobacter sp. HY1533 TaxID=2970919 RepID=UPI0022BA0536|nr:ABC transporter permease [Arthrobacter sp. HY1533]